MVYFIKWSAVSSMSDDGTVIGEANEKQFYLYLQEQYKGEYIFPSWAVVCRERRFCYKEKISWQEMADNFAIHLKIQDEAA